MNYYRKINKVVDDLKLKIQLGALTLKLSENNKKIDDLIGVDKNIKKDVSSNTKKIDTNTSDILGKIGTNTLSISNNLSKIDNISKFILKSDKDFKKTYNIEYQSFRFNKDNHFFSIIEKEIKHDFIKDSLLFIKSNIYYKYDDLSDDYHRCQHEYNIYGDNNNLIHKYLFNKDTYYDENSNILNTTEEFCIYFKKDYNKIKIVLELHRHNRHGSGNINLEIDDDGDNYIKLNYIEKGFLDNSHLVNLNTGSISTNSGLINANTSSISSNTGLIETNTSDISNNLGKIETNTSSISSNTGLIETNTSDISSNLEKITALQTSNIKAFYNLDKIFIFDIDNGYQNVNKNKHYHIFEKEITYNFVKNSYLEVALKVLTEISNYVLIGFFQVLCNFYDQDDNLFYTISLSTAMGSINKLSTITSVFIVPINENMSKIKIDFFIAPKETQENRSATFTIKDINSNKIYIKYFQKTNEMSIKHIQDSLNNIKLKNIYNIKYFDYKQEIKFNESFFNKTFNVIFKKNDYIEIDLKMKLEYEDIDDSKIITTEIKLYNDMDEEILVSNYINKDYILYSNFVFLNENILYNFIEDTEFLKIIIKFEFLQIKTIENINYIPENNNRLYLKHYSTS